MLDLDDLLAPIDATYPAGEDLAFSSELDLIQEARRADDPTLEQGDWVTDIKSADWPVVARTCSDLLRTRTKDLRIAAWLVEANGQLHGLAGLAQGYRLVAGLCDRYWDDLHPLPEGDDHEERIGNLGWLLGNSLQWLRTLPIVQAPQGRFGLGAFEAAHARGDQDPGDGRPGLELLEAARRDTPHGFYRQLLEDADDCVEALRELQLAVDARLGVDGPSFAAVNDQVDTLRRMLGRFAREAGVLTDDGGDAHATEVPMGTDAESTQGAPAAGSMPATAGPLASRRQALAQLRQVAEFFRRTEPHSPVAYLADKAARWGEMPLHVWLKRVIKDDATLAQMQEMLDVEDPSQDPYG
ncbi:type VI secretion system protein TssA [Luteimonas sp. MHLX1A]|uniref:type VI secretion system protein TssA n=1 Tax=Alterluteimonas muca TaxID=2878684 RepID=UPI001E48ECED|nr:type VI secretion system protein TssA [Luteimonas sp. MHLX1A]MCD9046989.1 type VI secretion system protein TssA [Luteimonas sp. MHLX1A]